MLFRSIDHATADHGTSLGCLAPSVRPRGREAQLAGGDEIVAGVGDAAAAGDQEAVGRRGAGGEAHGDDARVVEDVRDVDLEPQPDTLTPRRFPKPRSAVRVKQCRR